MCLTAGTRTGRYEIRSLLGTGGMGEVYLAEDTTLGRSVALKILPADAAFDRERMRRFTQEARAASILHHPNVAHIYEIGESDGTNFIAMEYVEGETLEARIKSGSLKTDEIARIAAETADALAEAHGHGITHRDIKPSNIIITKRGGVKVLDFGLAKVTEATPQLSDSDASTMLKTMPGAVMGTVAYMSPEQATGRETDARADIFSLGVVLYEMLTGRRPFAGASIGETIDRIARSQPEAIARFNYDVPAELERITRKCLEKDPERRYQSARELVVDLTNFQRDSVTNASGIEKSAMQIEQPRVPSRSAALRRPTVIVALVTLAAMILAAGLILYRSTERNRALNSIAILPLTNASNDADAEYLSDGLTESIINNLSQLPNLRVMSRNSVFRYKGRDVDARTVGRELGVEAILTGRVAHREGNLLISVELVNVSDNSQLWGGQYNRSMADILSVQEEIARQITEGLHLRLTSADEQRLARRGTNNPEAYRLYLRGLYYWYKYPAEEYHRSRDYFQQAIDLDPTYALGYAGLAGYYGFLASNGGMSPQEGWPRAEAAARRALALDPTLAEIHNFFAAQQLYYHRDWAAAEREFRRAIELNPNNAEVRQHYGLCLVRMGQSEEGIAELRRAVELDPLTLRINRNLGRAFYWSRRYGEAIEQYRRTLELDANYASAHEYLSDAYAQQGNHAEAVAAWRRAMILLRDDELATILDRAYTERGFEEAVRAVARRRLERLQERIARGQYVPAANVAWRYIEIGDREQAFAWLERAVEERNGLILEFIVDPRLDSWRSDPRFRELMRRIQPSR
jgi:eukaryotic-like serine/threonine-protein kinase